MSTSLRHFKSGDFIARRAQAAREVKLHPGTFADDAEHLDVPAALFDEAEHHAQAKPRALAVGFGGEKRFKRLGEHLRRHACPRVGHRYPYIVAGDNALAGAKCAIKADVFRAQVDGALTLHGVTGIDGQVENGIFQLIAIDEHLPEVGGRTHLHLEGFTQRTLQQLTQAIENLLRRINGRGQGLATSKREQLRRQFCPAFDGGNRRRHPALDIGVIWLMPGQQVQVAGDHLQQIVEVVGHAARQATDGFELL